MGGDYYCWAHLASQCYGKALEIRPAPVGSMCKAAKERCGNPAPFEIVDPVLILLDARGNNPQLGATAT